MHIPLTHKERNVLEYIEGYLTREGIAPSFLEIKDHFGFASFNSVQRYLKQLQKKEYIHIPGGNQKRSITILKSASSLADHLNNIKVNSTPRKEAPEGLYTPPPESLSLPLLGRVAAGLPLEAVEHDEFIDVPISLVKEAKESFALTVEGDSMIEEGIHEGDIILVQKQEDADNGDLVVATVENEATVKRFYIHKSEKDKPIELRPANSTMESFWYSPDDVHIRGVVVGLIRKF